MILADTSVWVNHFRGTDAHLEALLLAGEVIIHPWLIGELALGGLTESSEAGRLLGELGRSAVAGHAEVMYAIEARGLARRGIGYVDAHLLVAVLLTPGARLWTGDSKLAAIADELGVAMPGEWLGTRAPSGSDRTILASATSDSSGPGGSSRPSST